MCGTDPTAEVTKRRMKGGEFFLADHVRRDMQHLLASIAHHVGEHDGFLLSDERPLLQQIADDYGLEWPDEL
jgi:hypothetical protein